MADLYGIAAHLGLADHVACFATTRRSIAWLSASSKRSGHVSAACAHWRSDPDLVTVNGIRVTLADGTWGLFELLRTSPSLWLSSRAQSDTRMRDIFAALDAILRENTEVGAYNQTNLNEPPARNGAGGDV